MRYIFDDNFKTNFVSSFINGLSQHMSISLASFLWDTGKQNNPRCDAAKRGVPSGAILFACKIFIEK